jgi:hypothetical protein
LQLQLEAIRKKTPYKMKAEKERKGAISSQQAPTSSKRKRSNDM